ncbi:MAG: plasmid pRiA4b ORF-3 family protein [Nanoarchaeota archaeon]|nr:plasmid pRiA4b ORF-3 family protein [Nanoarchaeota archaeon]
MKKGKEITVRELLKYFDEGADIFSVFGSRTKDFTLIIDALESFVNQIKAIRNIKIKLLEEIKAELGELKQEELDKELMKRMEPQLLLSQQWFQKMMDEKFMLLLFTLPDRRGRRFLEIMQEIEEAGTLPMDRDLKQEKADIIISEFGDYISEIKRISKPFIPAKINPAQTIVFKVIFKYRKGIWRKIEMKATDTLHDLHNAIQDAIGWDNDHLYSFYMDNKFKKHDFDMEYTHPDDTSGEAKPADRAKVGIFGFAKDQKFAYLFDFGDGNRFEIEVADFGTLDANKEYPALIESKGKSPEQYPDWE